MSDILKLMSMIALAACRPTYDTASDPGDSTASPSDSGSGGVDSDGESSPSDSDSATDSGVGDSGPPDESGLDDTSDIDTGDTAPPDISDADGAITGEAEGDALGEVLSDAGDVDGDGLRDLWAFSTNNVSPAAYLFHGPLLGEVSALDAVARVSDASAQFFIRYSDTTTFSSAGDMDGDGFADLLLGCPLAGDDEQGSAVVLLGPETGDVDLGEADAYISSHEAGAWTGSAVSGPGDVNGDGFDDLLIGARYADVLGASSDLGDCPGLDPDGEDDLGAVDAGEVFLVLGPVSGERSTSGADATLTGEDGYDFAGDVLGDAGDLDGDGFMDLLVGAVGQCESGPYTGAVYIALGPMTGTISLADADGKLLAPSSGTGGGMDLAGDGDMDGDGSPDILIGLPGDDFGRAYLVLGPALGRSSLEAADAVFEPETSGRFTGGAVELAGDLDSDGFGDLLIGDPLETSGGRSAGAVYVVRGPVSGTYGLTSADIKLSGAVGAELGWDVTGLGDTNVDGAPDVLIGAPWSDLGGYHAGTAYLLLGGGSVLGSL